MKFEEELILSLDELIKSGDVVVEKSSDKYFAQLGTSFPTFGSKIDWEEVPGSVEENVKDDEYIESCLKFFTRICAEYGIKGRVVLVGDSALSCALIMSVEVLKRCIKNVLEIPQHHYIFPKDFSWCISFTMEGDMTFGFKPKKEKSG